jgi:hypothetical protein
MEIIIKNDEEQIVSHRSLSKAILTYIVYNDIYLYYSLSTKSNLVSAQQLFSEFTWWHFKSQHFTTYRILFTITSLPNVSVLGSF